MPIPESMRHLTLEEVEARYRAGRISDAELKAYLEAWNATRGRFTRAEWRDGAIRQTLIGD